MAPSGPPAPYVSRSGAKLDAALAAFGIDVSGLICADFGSHVGGFVDCLLRRGAARVYALEPGRGVLHERLRRDDRVVACEGANALRTPPREPCDLVTIDVGWTVQRLILPAARRWLRAGGQVVTLVKPQYEAPKTWLKRGLLDDARLPAALDACRADVADVGWTRRGEIESPVRGHGGAREFLWWLTKQ